MTLLIDRVSDFIFATKMCFYLPSKYYPLHIQANVFILYNMLNFLLKTNKQMFSLNMNVYLSDYNKILLGKKKKKKMFPEVSCSKLYFFEKKKI